MRIRYLIPGLANESIDTDGELKRRQEILQGWACSSASVEAVMARTSPNYMEASCMEHFDVFPVVQEVLRAESEGFDAFIIGCFGEPGLEGFRELTKMVVVGPASASIAAAKLLGLRFSILVAADVNRDPLRKLVIKAGALSNLASIRHVDTLQAYVQDDYESVCSKIIEAGQLAVVKDKAQALIVGCATLGFYNINRQMAEQLSVPVINPAKTSLKIAEGLVACHLPGQRKNDPYRPAASLNLGSS